MTQHIFLPQRQWVRLAAAWLLPCVACLVQWFFWDALEHFPWLLFYPAAFFAALIGGLWGGLGATLLSVLLAWWFFLPPPFSFGLTRGSDMLAISVFLASGMAFSLLLHRLMRSAETLRALFVHAGDGIAIIDDSEGRFVDINVRHAAMLGRPRQELIGAKVADYVIDFASASFADLSAQIQSDGAATFERQLRRADGSAVVTEVTVTPMQGKRVLAIVRDISKRREMEGALRNSEERFRLVVENSPNAIGLWDEQGRLRYVSAAITDTCSFSPQEMLERSASMYTAAGDLDGDELTPARAAALGIAHLPNAGSWLRLVREVRYCARHPGVKVVAEELTLTQDHGERVLQFIHQGFANSTGGREVVSILHDVTEQRTLERLLKQSNVELERQVAVRTAELEATVAELERANAGKDAFMAAISHELLTPLMGVLGMGELLESEVRGTLNPDQARYIRAICQSGERLLATVNGVLLYTNIMAGQANLQSEPCRLIELAAIAVNAVKAEAERKQQRLTQQIEPFDLQIESDSQGIINILKMLLDNAIKFTPEGGVISLVVVSATEGRGVRITVADTGIGMSEELAANLFRPFAQGELTLTRRFEGLGLGLAYVGKTVQLLGGAVSVESTLGQGSRFIVTLPLCREPAPLPHGQGSDGG